MGPEGWLSAEKFAAKPGDLSSVPVGHMVQRE